MAGKRTRSRQHRRDRRKAKASGWARAPKPMGAKIGHGTAGTTSTPTFATILTAFEHPIIRDAYTPPPTSKQSRLFVPMSTLARFRTR